MALGGGSSRTHFQLRIIFKAFGNRDTTSGLINVAGDIDGYVVDKGQVAHYPSSIGGITVVNYHRVSSAAGIATVGRASFSPKEIHLPANGSPFGEPELVPRVSTVGSKSASPFAIVTDG